MNNVLKAVQLLRTSHSVVTDYTRGGCWNFAEALRLLHNHPEGEVAYNQILGHAYYTFDRIKFYDIKGEHEFKGDWLGDFLFGEEVLHFKPERWCGDIYNRGRWKVLVYSESAFVIENTFYLDRFKAVRLLINSFGNDFLNNHPVELWDLEYEHSIIVKDVKDIETMYRELEEDGIDVNL